jgi:hypothetical protein
MAARRNDNTARRYRWCWIDTATDIVLKYDVLGFVFWCAFAVDFRLDGERFEFLTDAGEVGRVTFAVCEAFKENSLLVIMSKYSVALEQMLMCDSQNNQQDLRWRS